MSYVICYFIEGGLWFFPLWGEPPKGNSSFEDLRVCEPYLLLSGLFNAIKRLKIIYLFGAVVMKIPNGLLLNIFILKKSLIRIFAYFFLLNAIRTRLFNISF